MSDETQADGGRKKVLYHCKPPCVLPLPESQDTIWSFSRLICVYVISKIRQRASKHWLKMFAFLEANKTSRCNRRSISLASETDFHTWTAEQWRCSCMCAWNANKTAWFLNEGNYAKPWQGKIFLETNFMAYFHTLPFKERLCSLEKLHLFLFLQFELKNCSWIPQNWNTYKVSDSKQTD